MRRQWAAVYSTQRECQSRWSYRILHILITALKCECLYFWSRLCLSGEDDPANVANAIIWLDSRRRHFCAWVLKIWKYLESFIILLIRGSIASSILYISTVRCRAAMQYIPPLVYRNSLLVDRGPLCEQHYQYCIWLLRSMNKLFRELALPPHTATPSCSLQCFSSSHTSSRLQLAALLVHADAPPPCLHCNVQLQ